MRTDAVFVMVRFAICSYPLILVIYLQFPDLIGGVLVKNKTFYHTFKWTSTDNNEYTLEQAMSFT